MGATSFLAVLSALLALAFVPKRLCGLTHGRTKGCAAGCQATQKARNNEAFEIEGKAGLDFTLVGE